MRRTRNRFVHSFVSSFSITFFSQSHTQGTRTHTVSVSAKKSARTAAVSKREKSDRLLKAHRSEMTLFSRRSGEQRKSSGDSSMFIPLRVYKTKGLWCVKLIIPMCLSPSHHAVVCLLSSIMFRTFFFFHIKSPLFFSSPLTHRGHDLLNENYSLNFDREKRAL